MIHAAKPINFNVKVKYLSFSSSGFYSYYSQQNFFIGKAKRYPNKNIVIVPPAVIALTPEYTLIYLTD